MWTTVTWRTTYRVPAQWSMGMWPTFTWRKTYHHSASWRYELHVHGERPTSAVHHGDCNYSYMGKDLPPQDIMEMWTTFRQERPTSTVHHGDVDYIYTGKTYLHSISCRCGLHLHRKETYLHSASWRCGLHWTERLFVYMLCEEYGTSRSAGVAHSPLPHRSHLGSIS